MPQAGGPQMPQAGGPWAPVAPAPESNGMAIAAMVVGILSLVTFWLCGLGAVLGLVAVVLGAVALSKANKTPARTGRGQAIAGIATGAVALVISLAFLVFFVVVGESTPEFEEMNTDPSDGFCDSERFFQDPDC